MRRLRNLSLLTIRVVVWGVMRPLPHSTTAQHPKSDACPFSESLLPCFSYSGLPPPLEELCGRGRSFPLKESKRPRLMKGFSVDGSHLMCSPVYASVLWESSTWACYSKQSGDPFALGHRIHLASSEAFKAAVWDLANVKGYASQSMDVRFTFIGLSVKYSAGPASKSLMYYYINLKSTWRWRLT